MSADKRCRRCGEMKAVSSFALKPGNSGDGLDSYCRPCRSEYHRQWRLGRPGYMRTYYQQRKHKWSRNGLYVLNSSAKPCLTDGCDEPRYVTPKGYVDSRCAAHAAEEKRRHYKPKRDRVPTDPKVAYDRRYLAVRGLDETTYWALLARQGDRCAICGTHDPGASRWMVDHDHRCCAHQKPTRSNPWCGKCVRGLLCISCNWAIGFLGDDPQVAEAAARYLALAMGRAA